jgi:hypothetical protein
MNATACGHGPLAGNHWLWSRRALCAATVIATLPAAFAAAQQALGAIHFEGSLGGQPNPTIAADPSGCLPGAAQAKPAMQHVRRQLRCA